MGARVGEFNVCSISRQNLIDYRLAFKLPLYTVKGDPLDCKENVCQVLIECESTEREVCEGFCGFRKNKRCPDQFFVV